VAGLRNLAGGEVHEYTKMLAETREQALDRMTEEATKLENETDRISYAIFERQLEDRIAGYRFKTYQIPIDADSGFHTALAELPRQMPLDTVVGYESYLARLRAFPTYFEQQIAEILSLPVVWVSRSQNSTASTHGS